MPRNFPVEIENYLAEKLPSDDIEIFWIRAKVMDVTPENSVREVPNTQRIEKRSISIVDVYDVDALDLSNINPDSAIRITLPEPPRHYGIEPEDIISVFGDRKRGSSRIRPRFMINHNTSLYHKAYYDTKIDDRASDQFYNPVVMKTWLHTTYKSQSSMDRIGSFIVQFVLMGFLFVPALFFLAWVLQTITNALPKNIADNDIFNNIQIILLLAVPALWIFVAYSGSGETEKKFDLTEIYEHISEQIHKKGLFKSHGFEQNYRGY